MRAKPEKARHQEKPKNAEEWLAGNIPRSQGPIAVQITSTDGRPASTAYEYSGEEREERHEVVERGGLCAR
jgi:hypothetical protein